MGAFVPGTLILQSSPEGQALLSQRGRGATFVPFTIRPVTDFLPSGGGGGGTIPVPIIGPVLDQIFGLDTDLQRPLTVFQEILKSKFPNGDSPICGVDIDLTGLTIANDQVSMNIPCDDPNFGSKFRARDLDNLIVFLGLAQVLRMLAPYIHRFLPAAQPTPPTSGGGTNVQVVINEQSNIANSVLRAVANGINAGIDNSSQRATALVESSTNAITGAIGDFTKGLTGFLDSFSGGVGGLITNTLTSLFNPASPLEAAIAADISSVAGLLNDIQGQIVGPLGAELGTLTSAFAGLPFSLEQILQHFLKDLPKIFIEIFGEPSKWLERIAHWLEIFTGHLPGGATAKMGNVGIADILKEISDAAQEIAGVNKKPETIHVTAPQAIGVACSLESAKDQLAKMIGSGVEVDSTIGTVMQAVTTAFLGIISIVPGLEQFLDLSKEAVQESCPREKLAVGDILTALKRRVIDRATALEEMKKWGFSDNRIEVLFRLTEFYPEPDRLIDWWWRNVIDDEKLAELMSQNGVAPDQLNALKDASFRVTPINEGTIGWLRKVLTDEQYRDILEFNHLNVAQQDLLLLLARRPSTESEAWVAKHKRDILGIFSLPGVTNVDNVPAWFADAARANGLDDDATQHAWWSRFQVGDPATWGLLYFRGLRTFSEYLDAMGALGYVNTFATDILEATRPLIPFRTIPGMIAAGIITEKRGSDLLAQHGFDKESITDLLNYAKGRTKTAKATTAKTQHDTSLAAAKQLFIDGAITETQYRGILGEHGLSQDAIDNDVHLIQIDEATKLRKDTAQTIIDEYQAGVIDLATAQQELAQKGFSIAEQAKYARGLRKAKTAVAKVPPEGDLNHMMQKSIITQGEYVAALKALGYSDRWAGAWLQLRVGGGGETMPVSP